MSRALLVLFLAGCTTPGGTKVVVPTAPPPDESGPPVAPLHFGAVPPDEVSSNADVVSVANDHGDQLLVVSLPVQMPYGGVSATVRDGGVLIMDGNEARLCVRRPPSSAPVEGELWLPSSGDTRGRRVRFRAEATGSLDPEEAKNCSSKARFTSWSSGLDAGFAAFARARLGKTDSEGAPWERSQFLDSPIGLLTGLSSVDAAVQGRRKLVASLGARNVPAEKLAVPRIPSHPWQAMLTALGRTPPKEPLAQAVPAEFAFGRAQRIDTLFRLLDQVDGWVTPLAVSVLDESHVDRGLAARYHAQLGIERSPLARVFGPAVLSEIGLCMSDPYVREGTDMTLLFRLKNRPLAERQLDEMLASQGRAHGGLTQERRQIGGVEVRVATSADGQVHQHRATLGDLEIVSNSPGAMTRVLEAAQGKRPRLADELDWQYMLARDAGTPSELLFFAGDRFIRTIVGGPHRIAEARRMIAAAELAALGYATLLHGWMRGRAPRDVEELIGLGLLSREDLRHSSGEPIAFTVGGAARSTWGTVASLTPLIDLPPVTMVSESELNAYRRFADDYRSVWSTYLDPLALRVSAQPAGALQRWTFDLRVLPLPRSGDHRKLLELIGRGHIKPGALSDGLRAVFGLGREGELRHTGRKLISGFGLGDINIDWLGGWAMLGIGDARTVLQALRGDPSSLPQIPGEERDRHAEEKLLSKVPFYAGIGVRNAAGATLAIAALRKWLAETAGERLQFGDGGKHRGLTITDVKMVSRRDDPSRDIHVYYALSDDAFYVSLDSARLKRLLDDEAGKRAPGPSDEGGPQLSVSLAARQGGPMWTAALWLVERNVRHTDGRASRIAEVVMRGAPAASGAALDALFKAYLGFVPVTPSGKRYERSASGPRDPERGSEVAPEWPKLPIPGSAVTVAFERIADASAEVSIDDEGPKLQPGQPASGEPPLQSLHARTTLDIHE
jgi:hypothetical protein